MAEMGLGYGSEYHLLRYLGHHRNELNNIIKANTRLIGDLMWLDYPKDLKRMSLDGEYTGLKFLNDPIFDDIFSYDQIQSLKAGWKDYWPTRGSQQNLDGIIISKYKNHIELIIVEAKAHLREIRSNTESASNEKIEKAFKETQNNLNISNNNWFGKHYQLANRLALINYLKNNEAKVEINASLLYIYFLNGYDKRQLCGRKITAIENKSVENQEDWEKIIKNEYIDLGISNIANQYILKVFINCK